MSARERLARAQSTHAAAEKVRDDLRGAVGRAQEALEAAMRRLAEITAREQAGAASLAQSFKVAAGAGAPQDVAKRAQERAATEAAASETRKALAQLEAELQDAEAALTKAAEAREIAVQAVLRDEFLAQLREAEAARDTLVRCRTQMNAIVRAGHALTGGGMQPLPILMGERWVLAPGFGDQGLELGVTPALRDARTRVWADFRDRLRTDAAAPAPERSESEAQKAA